MTALYVPLSMLEHVPIARLDMRILIWLGTALRRTAVIEHLPGVLRRVRQRRRSGGEVRDGHLL
eukprot:1946954-Alexandrium_andersonii.AAC.1